MAENTPLEAIIEGILFAYGEEISIDMVAKAAGVKTEAARAALENLRKKYNQPESGLTLIENGRMVRLASSPKVADPITKLVKQDFEEKLTTAALETLTIVTYLTPVSRAEIDYVRGVNSGFMLRSLLLRGLLSRRPDPKRPYIYLYEPTFKLLEHMGISRVEEMPDYEKYRSLFKFKQAEAEKE